MTCAPVSLGGVNAIVCTRGRGKAKFCACGRPATKLCDFPVGGEGKSKTCDKPLCDACAVGAGGGLDHCPGHVYGIKVGSGTWRDARGRWHISISEYLRDQRWPRSDANERIVEAIILEFAERLNAPVCVLP